MTVRFPALFTSIAMALMGVALPGVADEDGWSVPRTPDGKPDLQGVWSNNSATPLQRPDQLGDKTELSDEEVAELQARAGKFATVADDAAFGDTIFSLALADEQEHISRDGKTGSYNNFWMVEREFENRTSLIVDPPNGKLPPLTEEAKVRQAQRRAYAREHAGDSYANRSNTDRCITFGAPFIGAGYNSYFRITQTPQHVVVLQEMIHEARIFPIDGRPHIDGDIRQWLGDSRGRWEGDTLVVETTNFSPKSRFFQSSEHLNLTERYTRIADDVLQWEVAVEDPTTWTAPWTAVIRMKKTDEALFEYACHEGNYAMEGILAGKRLEEQESVEGGD